MRVLELVGNIYESKLLRQPRPIWLASLIEHLFLALDQWHGDFKFVCELIHNDLATTLMIFGLVTFAKVKLHLPSFIIRNAIHRALTRLVFVPEVGNLEGSMWV